MAHVLASIGLEFREIGQPPEIYFDWSNKAALAAPNLNFLCLGPRATSPGWSTSCSARPSWTQVAGRAWSLGEAPRTPPPNPSPEAGRGEQALEARRVSEGQRLSLAHASGFSPPRSGRGWGEGFRVPSMLLVRFFDLREAPETVSNRDFPQIEMPMPPSRCWTQAQGLDLVEGRYRGDYRPGRQ